MMLPISVIGRSRVRYSAGAGGEFSFQELTLCADSYLVSVQSPRYRIMDVTDPGHSAKSAGGQVTPAKMPTHP